MKNTILIYLCYEEYIILNLFQNTLNKIIFAKLIIIIRTIYFNFYVNILEALLRSEIMVN